MAVKKSYIPVTQEQLVHDLTITWLSRDKKEYNATEFVNEYLRLTQTFTETVDQLTQYDFNPMAPKELD
ncbi:hypothetical protein [Lysinibacillus sp. NPDC047702]|uniref:hypothetical protein n=1 Tax=unclassified Lysinibacillus TaxID=2636778 RepID=UPI003D005E7E